MAYFQPNSTVEFFNDLGLSPNYENTLYFATTDSKDSYFFSLTKIATVSSVSYVRENRGFIRVELPMSTMFRVGYMRFKNTSFENKWFYAFVKGANYINNITTEIEFEIDVMMTWMGIFNLNQCFIERQHSTTDAIGDNIIDEGLPCGDYKNDFETPSGYVGSNGWWYCFASTFDPDNPNTDATGETYGGIYSGVMYSYTNLVATINQWIRDATTAGKSDGIVGIAMVPRSFITEGGDNVVKLGQTINKPYSTVNGYTPKNNKLFVYPYKYLLGTNMEGNFAEYRYEFFSGVAAQFQFTGATGLSSEIICTPVNYKGLQENYSEKMSMSDFPMCAYSIDSFEAWLAQNKSSIAANVVSSAAQLATFTAQPMSLASGANMVGQVAQTLGTMMDYARKPPQAGGAQGTSALFGSGTGTPTKDFYFVGKTINSQYARIIDDFFTMYGYKMHRVGTPNMNARPYFTYVKTIGCSIDGNLPVDDAAKIENIFDNGIRFWKDHTQIGNYTLNNAPT